jgi:rifampicin phosphotransferase
MAALPIQDDHLVWLDAACHGRELVGGKGASLSNLISLGAPVPPAIGLTTRAYSALATALGLPTHSNGWTTGDLAVVRHRITESPLTAAVADLLARAYAVLDERLGAGHQVAVRSSAVDEDSAAQSFAGLHDTVLGVRGESAFEAAVRRCWASLWTDRAMAYRAGGSVDEIAIAVVAQQLVRCDVSFVAFTADPVTGRDDRLVIDATFGLGEAIVSGMVNPDHIAVGPDGAIVDYRVGDKRQMVIADDAGVRAVPVPRVLNAVPALTTGRVGEIAATCRSLSARLGYPADIEGGFADDRLYIFQARPITSLASNPPRKPASVVARR